MPVYPTKRRYVAFKIIATQPPTKKELMESIWQTILRLHGELGASKTGLYLIEYNQQTSLGVIRCAHKAVEILRSSLTSLTKINEKNVIIQTLHVSGTIKSLKRKLQTK